MFRQSRRRNGVSVGHGFGCSRAQGGGVARHRFGGEVLFGHYHHDTSFVTC